ncbi:MAG: hypothetical protein HRU13_04350, partial [Phycisphaerales bacterium]|nr:hypothetical protein [Phycisphaerales bacterium]
MVRSSQSLDDADLWSLTNDLLVQKGLTTVTIGDRGGLSVTQLSAAARLARPTNEWAFISEGTLETPSPAGFVALLYDLEQAEAEPLISAVQPLLSGDGSITRLGDSNTLIIADLRDRAAQVLRLLRKLDIRTTETRSYEPRLFSPEEVGQAVQRLIGEDVEVVADGLTGTLVVEATASQHDAIASLIERLDAETSSARLSTRTITVRHRPVEEIVSLVNRLLGAGVAGEPDTPIEDGVSTTRLAPDAPTAAERARQRADSGNATDGVIQIDGITVSLVADEATSRILAIGPPGVLDRVQELVRELDIRQPQVMLDVTLVSLTEGETLDLGVELERIEVSGDIRIRLASLFGLSTGDGDANRDAGDGAGFTGVVLDPGDFAVVVRALETVNQGRSL